MTLPVKIFGVKVKPVTIAQAVRVYLANQRKANAKTKTRGEVERTTAKMYKQKGTGKARHGSFSAPIFVGGGIAHGPTGEQNYKLNLPAKVRRLAIKGVLTNKAKAKQVTVLDDAVSIKGKTKEAQAWMKKTGLTDKKISLILTNGQDGLERAFRNIEKVKIVRPNNLNVYNILTGGQIVITSEALAEMTKLYVS